MPTNFRRSQLSLTLLPFLGEIDALKTCPSFIYLQAAPRNTP